jgi:ABC-type Na+ transport system ATPase subunit NatA
MAILHAGALRFSGSPAALRASEDEESLEKAFLRRIEHAAAPE